MRLLNANSFLTEGFFITYDIGPMQTQMRNPTTRPPEFWSCVFLSSVHHGPGKSRLQKIPIPQATVGALNAASDMLSIGTTVIRGTVAAIPNGIRICLRLGSPSMGKAANYQEGSGRSCQQSAGLCRKAAFETGIRKQRTVCSRNNLDFLKFSGAIRKRLQWSYMQLSLAAYQFNPRCH